MNELHTFLSAGNVQARPVLGQTVEYGDQDDLIGFCSPMDEKAAFELGGSMDEMDRVLVISRDQFEEDNLPAVETDITVEGVLMRVKAVKRDQSAFVMGLAMLDAEVEEEP
jgi:hypothetical protein